MPCQELCDIVSKGADRKNEKEHRSYFVCGIN